MKKSEELFMQYCREYGMNEDDIRACSWYKAGMIDFADWVLRQNSEKHIVRRRLPCAEDVKRWHQLLIGFGEEKMMNDVQATFA